MFMLTYNIYTKCLMLLDRFFNVVYGLVYAREGEKVIDGFYHCHA